MITDREIFETISKRLAATPMHNIKFTVDHVVLQKCVNLCMKNLITGKPFDDYRDLERLGILALVSIYGHDVFREKMGLKK